MSQIRVALADDHPIVRGGIRGLLEQEPDIAVVGEASTGAEASRLARELAPDVLLLDLELPGMPGVEVARSIQRDGPAVRVLVLSAHDDERHIRESLSSGAAGYLTKAEAPGCIVDAVRGVARGDGGWFSRGVMALVARAQHERARPRTDGLSTLTPREQEVLTLIAGGHDNPHIAAALYISEGTVKNHVTNIYDKLEIRTRAEAVTWAWRHGLTGDVGDDKNSRYKTLVMVMTQSYTGFTRHRPAPRGRPCHDEAIPGICTYRSASRRGQCRDH